MNTRFRSVGELPFVHWMPLKCGLQDPLTVKPSTMELGPSPLAKRMQHSQLVSVVTSGPPEERRSTALPCEIEEAADDFGDLVHAGQHRDRVPRLGEVQAGLDRGDVRRDHLICVGWTAR